MASVFDVIIIGAGAAGLLCGITAGQRGRRVLILDHSNKVGKKILMSGGGRCNFTNYNIHPDCYISHNSSFCKSALSRYTQWDFIAMVERHRIAYHEKTLGQLFCNDKASAIVTMLLAECRAANVAIRLQQQVLNVTAPTTNNFQITTAHDILQCESLVIATGGLSIPTMGATAFGYKIAEQFGLHVYPTRAALVPFTLHDHDKQRLATLSGVSADTRVTHKDISFRENMLFTHRGISGPACLQISSYWTPGDELIFDLLPEQPLAILLDDPAHAAKTVKTVLAYHLPKNLLATILPAELLECPVKSLVPKQRQLLATCLHEFTLRPNGTEGYRTAEVTLGGVDCNALSSKTMMANTVPGLYFIGEVVDVTGWLGGYNFQWAWSSGWAAGVFV